MLPDLKNLLILQNRDREISELQTELETLPKDEEKARLRLKNDQEAVGNAKEARQRNEMAIKTIELDIGTRRQSLKRLKTQQFETRKNEEFQKFGIEMDRYLAQIDELETKELEAMEKADQLKAELDQAQASLAETEKKVAAQIETLHQASAERRAHLDELQASRPDLSDKVGEEALALYERLLGKKDGQAVVAVGENRQCQGCHVKLTPSTYIQVQADKSLTQCDNCGRILYADN